VVPLLPDLSLRERELQQLKAQLAERSAALAATAAQLIQLQTAHAQQTDQLADLLIELSTVRSESTHRVATAEAAVTALQAEAQALEHPAPMNTTSGPLSANSTADESTPAEATSQREASLTQPLAAWFRAAAIAGGSDAIELPPSTEASQLHLDVSDMHNPGHPTVAAGDALSLLHLCGGPVPRIASVEQPPNNSCIAGHIIQPAQQAAAVVGPGQGVSAGILTPAAAVATASLLATARAAVARAAAGESREQQLLQEVSLQHELHELQQQELTVLKQRLAASEQEAARLSTRLQSKQRQLQQLQAKLTALKQQQEGAQVQSGPGLKRGYCRHGQQSAAAGGSPAGSMRSPAGPGAAYSTVQHSVQLAAAPAAYTSYARASNTDMQAACQSSSPASPSASRATGCAASGSTSPSQQAVSAESGASTAYAHAEEVSCAMC